MEGRKGTPCWEAECLSAWQLFTRKLTMGKIRNLGLGSELKCVGAFSFDNLSCVDMVSVAMRLWASH